MKQKSRKVRHTILIYCEGEQDSLFVQHLKRLFLGKNKRIKIRSGHGGGMDSMIAKATRQPGEYDEKYIFLDEDQQIDKKEFKSKAKSKDITLIFSPLCLENLFLQILNGHPQMLNSKKCKSFFQEKYSYKKYSRGMMEKLFPKKLLNDRKKGIPALKTLIQIIS